MSAKKAEQPADAKPPFDAEAFSSEIEHLSRGMTKLLSARLNKRAIILLLHDACGQIVSKTVIERVLDAMPELEQRFLRKAAAR